MAEEDEGQQAKSMMESAVPGAVLWTWQTSDIMLAVTAVGSTFLALDFMLVPLSMAYFVTFMMLPFLELFEKRPFNCPGGKVLCEESAPWTRLMPVFEDEENKIFKYDDNRNVVLKRTVNPGDDAFFEFETDEEGNDVLDDEGNRIRKKDSKGRDIKISGVWAKEAVMLGKMPHAMACLLTLFASFGTVIGLLSIVVASFQDFATSEEEKASRGQPTIKDDMYKMGNEFIDQLEVDGVVIIRPRECYKRNVTDTLVVSDLRDSLTVQSALFNGDTSSTTGAATDYATVCRPVTITNPVTQTVRDIDVRVYNADGFRCDIDWEKTVEYGSTAKAVCAFDTLTMAAVQDSNGPLHTDGPAGANGEVITDCIDAFVGRGEYGPTITGDVITSVNLTEMVANRPMPFMRALAGLNGAVNDLTMSANAIAAGGTDPLATTCATSHAAGDSRDVLLTKLCDFLETPGPAPASADEVAPADLAAMCTAHSGTLDDTNAEAETKEANCRAVELCDYVPAYVAGAGAKAKPMPPVCKLSNWVSNSLNATTYTTMCESIPNSHDGCTTQLEWQKTFYANQLNNMRATQPTTVLEMGVRFYNFTETMTQVPDNCTKEDLFKDNEDGQKWEDFLSGVGAIGAIINDTVLILLLGVYILMERSPELPENRVILEIEAMVKNYINLKVMLSAATGIFVGAFLIVCEVQLAMVFGLLAFMLNFIPCVGSAIASVLPLPLIVLDDNLDETDKLVAFFGPASVQGYIGNALEPALFGKSLNLTEISVLNALVLCQLCWGLSGAVLSVPMLGILKIICHHTDHPMAKYTLAMVRADASFP